MLSSIRNVPAAWVVLLLAAATLSSCPNGEGDDDQPGVVVAEVTPSTPIPEIDLAQYEGLRLGMSHVQLAQVYPAPDGQGEGYTRGFEDFGDVRVHTIKFETVEGEPTRRIIASLYRDELAKLAERRDGLTDAQATAWHIELNGEYGDGAVETIAGAQWTWEQDGVRLIYTQDNASPENMSANVVLEHLPTYEAAHRYLELREEANS
jgi:hypothetical protein